jgi:hypothetical protein
MDYINSLFSQKPDKTLYHYTSQAGLLGILKTKRLWLANLSFLNDSMEFRYTTELMRMKILSSPATMIIAELKELMLHYIRNLEDIIVEEFGAYVFSFSEVGDLLSQWRGYCSESLGFSIGFNVDVIQKLVSESGQSLRLGKCVYDTKFHDQIISEILNNAITNFNKLPNNLDEKDLRSQISNSFIRPLMLVAPLIKNESFQEERERRIISFQPSSNKFIKHREGERWIIPYLELPFVKDDEKMIFDEIIISPNPHAELTQSSLNNFIASEEISVGKINNSKIPYRAK